MEKSPFRLRRWKNCGGSNPPRTTLKRELVITIGSLFAFINKAFLSQVGVAALDFVACLLFWRAVRSSAAPLAWGFLIGVLCNRFPTFFLIIFVLGDRQIEKEVLPLWPKRHFNNKDTLIILKEKLWKKQLVMAWTRQAHRSLRAHLHTVEPV